ncbi:PcfJ domain-containing protein [Dialister invisus]|uniref:PcfJ domain-containing protein n=1 Tax=Dialister invisus TaxID=218538 RepID=UPI00267033E3|nr:PcfJ domain-containing protein [Dialister invisus]
MYRRDKDCSWIEVPESGQTIVPYSINLAAKEYKSYLDICIESTNVDAKSPIDVSTHTVRKYTLRFDFKTRETLYLQHGAFGRVSISHTLWPLNKTAYDNTRLCMKDTVFRYLNAESSIRYAERKRLDSFFRNVVDCFNRKLSEAAGYKIKSAYTPTNTQNYHGAFDYCFSNLVWRLKYPDARNLTTTELHACPYSKDPVVKLVEDSGKPYLRAIRKIYDFPDMPGLNTQLAKCPIHFLSILRSAWPVFHEIDNRYKLLDRMLAPLKCSIGFYQSAESYLRSLRIIKHTRGEAAAVKLMEREDSYNVQDCGHMWDLLTPQNKRKFIRAKIRSRDIHDYLTRLADKQQHANVRIKYKSLRDFPLTGKVDDLIFSLPPDTEQLANLGRAMHNCVGTYRNRVLSDKVRIIAAFKNRKPVICIEIKNGAVAQAKLVNNKPVRDDAELNHALLAWAKSRKLIVETNDVQTERKVAGVAAAV